MDLIVPPDPSKASETVEAYEVADHEWDGLEMGDDVDGEPWWIGLVGIGLILCAIWALSYSGFGQP